MARKLEEPEKWITVNGQHLPVYPGGRIGQPGQKPPAEKKTKKKIDRDGDSFMKKTTAKQTELKTMFKNDPETTLVATRKRYDGLIDEYTVSKTLSGKNISMSYRQIDGKGHSFGGGVTTVKGYFDVAQRMNSMEENGMEFKSKTASKTAQEWEYNKSAKDLYQDMENMAASGKYKNTDQLKEAYVDYLSKMPQSKRNELARMTGTGGRGTDRIMAMAGNMANNSDLPARDKSFKKIEQQNQKLREMAKANITSTDSRGKKEIKPYTVEDAVIFASSPEEAKEKFAKTFPNMPKKSNPKIGISKNPHYLEQAKRKTGYLNEGAEKDVVASYKNSEDIPSKLGAGESIVLKRNLGKGKYEYEGKGTYGTSESPTEVAIADQGFKTAQAAKKAFEERKHLGTYEALVVRSGDKAKTSTPSTTSRNARYDTSRSNKKNAYEGKSISQLQLILKNLRTGASITGTSQDTAKQIAEIEQEIARRKKK